MAKGKRVHLFVFGLLALIAAFFIPGLTRQIISHALAGRVAAEASPVFGPKTSPAILPFSADSASFRLSSAPSWDPLRSPAARRHAHVTKPASITIPPWQRILAQSAPKAHELFESGMAFLRSGSYVEARRAFQTLIRTYAGDKAVPLAYWAMALSYYDEGGYDNLLLAADQLRNYLIFFPGETEYEDLAIASHTDIAVIWNELRSSTLPEELKIREAKDNFQMLTQFLKEYPKSPSAPGAKIQLAETEQYLASVGAQKDMLLHKLVTIHFLEIKK